VKPPLPNDQNPVDSRSKMIIQKVCKTLEEHHCID
jgi:hypothetical protein